MPCQPSQTKGLSSSTRLAGQSASFGRILRRGPWISVPQNSARRRPWVLRVVLSYSRKAYSDGFFRQETENFVRGVENAPRAFGGSLSTLRSRTSRRRCSRPIGWTLISTQNWMPSHGIAAWRSCPAVRGPQDITGRPSAGLAPQVQRPGGSILSQLGGHQRAPEPVGKPGRRSAYPWYHPPAGRGALRREATCVGTPPARPLPDVPRSPSQSAPRR